MKALASSDLRRIVEDNGLFIVGSSPDEFAAYIKLDFGYQSKLMDDPDLRQK